MSRNAELATIRYLDEHSAHNLGWRVHGEVTRVGFTVNAIGKYIGAVHRMYGEGPQAAETTLREEGNESGAHYVLSLATNTVTVGIAQINKTHLYTLRQHKGGTPLDMKKPSAYEPFVPLQGEAAFMLHAWTSRLSDPNAQVFSSAARQFEQRLEGARDLGEYVLALVAPERTVTMHNALVEAGLYPQGGPAYYAVDASRDVTTTGRLSAINRITSGKLAVISQDVQPPIEPIGQPRVLYANTPAPQIS